MTFLPFDFYWIKIIWMIGLYHTSWNDETWFCYLSNMCVCVCVCSRVCACVSFNECFMSFVDLDHFTLFDWKYCKALEKKKSPIRHGQIIGILRQSHQHWNVTKKTMCYLETFLFRQHLTRNTCFIHENLMRNSTARNIFANARAVPAKIIINGLFHV